MKRIFKIVLMTIGVFWGTIIILQAKSEVTEYVLQHKKAPEVVETTDFISKKGGGFIKYLTSEIDLICSEIDLITKEFKKPKNLDNMTKSIQELERINLGLKEIVEKKPFIGLDSFIIKINDFSSLVSDYINFIKVELEKNDDFDIKVIEEKQSGIENTKISIEELIKTIEVN